MQILIIEGGNPLNGTVYLSGAKNSALKLIHAAMFSNEDVILSNVPRIGNVLVDLEAIVKMGGKAEWLDQNKLLLNGSGLNTHEIPFELGTKYRTLALLAGPLLFRFGQVNIPKPGGCKIGPRPINRLVDTWINLGVDVTEDDKFFKLRATELTGTNINFKVNTHMGTDNAIISALFAKGETVISNAAEEVEVDDLIAFCNVIGGHVERTEPNRIRITGTNVFKGGSFAVQTDRNEAVTFAVAALMTHGNITISGANSGHLLSFLNILTKMGCRYEFSRDEMRIWYGGEKYNPVKVTTAPAPGIMTDWQPLITLLLTLCEGESLVHDTVYTDRFGYTKDLNRMGANIELFQPSTLDITPVISDDQYDYAKHGEPFTVAKVIGPTLLKGGKVLVPDLRAGATLMIAGLAASGETEVDGYDNVSRGYENFKEKLISLGAKIREEEI